MIRQAKVAPGEEAAFAGEVFSLLDQLGSPEQKVPVSGFFSSGKIHNEQDLRSFLSTYQAQVLIPLELQSIFQAYQHATRNECRELIALDQKLSSEPRLQSFAAASQRVGQLHLSNLKPLRDHRLVQRYLHAIEVKEAFGWHMLVYGVILAVYSTPLRQSLNAFANQTLQGFCAAIGRARHFDENICRQIALELTEMNQFAVEKLFATMPFIV